MGRSFSNRRLRHSRCYVELTDYRAKVSSLYADIRSTTAASGICPAANLIAVRWDGYFSNTTIQGAT